MSSGAKSTEEALKLFRELDSAKSAEETLKVFRKLEKTCEDERQLGVASWQLAQQLSDEGGDPEQILYFAKRALKTQLETEIELTKEFTTKKSLLIASLLTKLGTACFALKRFDESLSYFNWCDRNLRKLEADQSVPADMVLPLLLATQAYMYVVKVSMGRSKEEFVVHAKTVVEMREKVLEKDCMELGKLYDQFSDGCIEVKSYKEALPFCLKAVAIHARHLGQDSVEVARLRMKLGIIYSGLEDYEKAIEQNQLAQSVLKKDESSGEVLIEAKLENADMLVHLGRYQEALAVLKGVVSNASDNESQLAIAYISMAKAYCRLEKLTDAKKHMKLALGFFDLQDMDPDAVATDLDDALNLVEEMRDVRIFVSMLLLTMIKIPQEIGREYSTRLAELMLKEKGVEGQGPSEEDKLDEAFALLKLVKENTGGFVERFFANNTEAIISKVRKASSSH